MPTIKRFEEIEAWKTARDLTNLIYRDTEKEPFARDFALKDQIRRAAISIMSNIAEGFESRTQTQFINFLGLAKGSAGEVRAQLYLALDLLYLNEHEFAAAYELADKASRQLSRFIAYLQSNPSSHQVKENGSEYEVKM